MNDRQLKPCVKCGHTDLYAKAGDAWFSCAVCMTMREGLATPWNRRAPAVSAERPGREAALCTALKGLMNEWHRQAEAYEKDSKKSEPATGREMARAYSALLDRVASDLKLTITSVTHAHPAPVKADMLAWLAGQKRLELDYGFDSDYEDMFWRVHERTGNVNDREWDLIGQGATPLEALLSAKSFLESAAVPATPEGEDKTNAG